MNTLFDPSLLFIADNDWLDEEKQDDFLAHLLNHLACIDEYDICKIWWTDELQTILVSNPNMHPWYGKDLSNPLVATIYKLFYTRLELIEALDTICQITPPLSITYTNENTHTHFLQLVHSLINQEVACYFCVGISNQLKPLKRYTFSCDCHTNTLIPTLLNNAKEWLTYVDVVEQFFPASLTDFEEKFAKGMEVIKQRAFEDKPYLYSFTFTNNFKRSIVNRRTFKEEIFTAMVRKLVATAAEASRNPLQDECIDAKQKEYRFRVTQRPHSTRIHYKLNDDNTIEFLRYYGEGEHDDGLR